MPHARQPCWKPSCARGARREQFLQALIKRLKRNPYAKVLPYVPKQGRSRQTTSGKREDKVSRWDREVTAFLDRQYAKEPNYRSSLLTLWQAFIALDLPSQHFVSEFTSGRKTAVF